MPDSKKYILTAAVAEKKMRRMALEIAEQNSGEDEIVLAGIKESGTIVARCIQQMLNEMTSVKSTLIQVSLDKKKPKEVLLDPAGNFDNKVVIIVDDVSNSGRTLLYALKPFLEFYPKKIQTLILVERRHNDFPVRPDYIGLSITTTLQEHIVVEVDDEKVTGAYLR
jgi:pyrimidine operon attenuation protein/uracil phosphoribosyltransferase